MEIKILDCTLRDGGYLVDKHFHEGSILNIVNGLTQAGVDFVELGFLQDEIGKKENVCFRNSVDARKYIPLKRGNTLYTAFADFSRYSISNLDAYDGRSFDCIRACFFKEERKDAISFCREIKKKGYKIFIQPVGVLRYSTSELLELIADFNELEPFCFGIVDTFGSMYLEDLDLKTAIIHSELLPNIKLGFHSHSNMNLSDALSQMFIRLMKGERDICVDATLLGMGRGAGNAHTECITEYLNKKHGKSYNIDIIADTIENSINKISERTKWGYSLLMFLAGAFSSHINNVGYLSQKAGFRTRDIRYVLGKLSDDELAHYYYDRLDELYLERISEDSSSSDGILALRNVLSGKPILIVAPGNTVATHKSEIVSFIAKNNPIVISINFIPDGFNVDYIYFNNPRRYDYAQAAGKLHGKRKILTTNIQETDTADFVINIKQLLKYNTDNSVILLLNLLDMLCVSEISIAGFDGFNESKSNYATGELEKSLEDMNQKNAQINMFFKEFLKDKTVSIIRFITPSIFNKQIGAI